MKQINLFKSLLLVAFLCATGIVNAQIHPLAFGVGAINTNPNWYANYVGLRFEVVSPASDAGTKAYTTAYSGTTPWGGQVIAPIVNVPIQMPQAGDSLCTVGTVDHTITTDMTGKIGFVYRGSAYFGDKADDCQNAGAVACVIVNNVAGGPVGMASAGAGASVTIPVFMISKADGDIIDSLYNAGVVAHFTITPWGQGYNIDLGFVPFGAASWHAYAVPANQVGSSGNPTAYNMLDGAFIANYGLDTAINVKLKSTLSFTPNSTGITTPQHSSEVDLESPFAPHDSIYAMFNAVEYGVSASGPGRFDLTYTIQSDSTDAYPADNTQTVSFYTTDTVFSKGTYDFTRNQPVRTLYEAFGGGVEFLWGPMYYVANNTNAIGVQYALAMNSTTTGYPYLPTSNNIYIFKWNDGTILADSIVQDGELELVGSAVKTYDGVSDTSESLLYQTLYADTSTADSGPGLSLLSNSWYYVCIDVPATTFLGCDGNLSPYPRIYGRYQANVGGSGNHLLDYSNFDIVYSAGGFTKDSLYYYLNQGNPPCPSGMTYFLNSVDSFVYSNMEGLVPAVALTTSPWPLGTKSVTHKSLTNVSLYPNPAKDLLNVAVSFDKNEPTVTYEIIDGLARFVSKETHYNVQNETLSINTANLAPGHYYLTITASGRVTSKKFIVIK